jgi:hypothetical protein
MRHRNPDNNLESLGMQLLSECPFLLYVKHQHRTRGSVVVEALCYKPKGRGIESRKGGFIQLTKSFQPHYGPGVDSASNRNEYQESSWEVKGGRRVRLTTSPPSV